MVKQAVAPHTRGEHAVVTAAGHRPEALQLAAAVAVPPVQLAVRHEVVVAAIWQTPPLAHVPVLHGGELGQRASAALTAIAPHVPFAPDPFFAAEQALQAAVQALLQQNPSTQNPDVHSDAPVQVVPFAFFATQFGAEQ